MELYVGLDVSLKETSICVVDGKGEIVSEGTVISEPAAIAAFIKAKAKTPFASVSRRVRRRRGFGTSDSCADASKKSWRHCRSCSAKTRSGTRAGPWASRARRSDCVLQLENLACSVPPNYRRQLGFSTRQLRRAGKFHRGPLCRVGRCGRRAAGSSSMACAARRSAMYWESDFSSQPLAASAAVGVIISAGPNRFGGVTDQGGTRAISRTAVAKHQDRSQRQAHAATEAAVARASSCQASHGPPRCPAMRIASYRQRG